MSTTTQKGYCAGCYGEAEKAGRSVRTTDLYEYPLCIRCEARMREGLIHYRPSNGAEFRYFESRCEDCRHFIDDHENPKPGQLERPFATCSWGVLDRIYVQMWSSTDHISNWFDPADISTRDVNGKYICPAECKRFTHKDERDGELREPPKPDCEGQMFFGDLDIPVERVPERKAVTR
jgi:hypothetical protein